MEVERQSEARALVQALCGPSPRYKRSEVEAVVARREETAPYLLEILRAALADPEGYLAELGENFDPLYAVALLAHLRESAAHDLLIELCRLPTEQFERLIGGFITEGMERALFATCDGRTDRIRELLLDPRADAYLRAQAANALAMAVHQGLLAAQLVPDVANPDSYFWNGICAAMLQLHPVEHAEALLRAWDERLIDPFMFHRLDIEEAIARGPEAAVAGLAGDVEQALTPNVHDWLGWWACFHPILPQPQIAPEHERHEARRGAKAAAKKARKRQQAARKKQRRK